ncbi:MAG: histidine triad nucleotide-binding protein [Chloroflexota bacterium]
MKVSTIFKKIIDKEIPADVVYEDELVLAFKDINPQAPVHILIIPKKEIATVNDVTDDDEQRLGRLFIVAAKIAKEQGIDKSGYRLIVNINEDGGQEVFHLHMHILGGHALGPMLAKKS